MLIATFPSLRRRGNGRPVYSLHDHALQLSACSLLGQAPVLKSHAPVIAEADKCAGGKSYFVTQLCPLHACRAMPP